MHDSTFSHALQAGAISTTHATAVEAAHVAAESGARALWGWPISNRHDEANEALMFQKARALFPMTFLSRDFLVWEVPRLRERDL